MSSFWSLWIIILTTITIVGVTWILFANRTSNQNENNETTGHAYDGIEEYDNPLPAWWFNMFVATIIFAVVYLIVYPGMGTYKGIFSYLSDDEAYKDGWTQIAQLEIEEREAEAQFLEVAGPLVAIPAADLVENHQALRMGQRLFKSNCGVCHGSDGKGSYAFPNLTDDAWLYGGSEANIKQSITDGRRGAMPAWGSVLGQDLDAMVDFVQTVSDPSKQELVATHPMSDKYQMLCSACHGKDAKGNQALGAPNLTDGDWLYSGSTSDIKMSISQGRNGIMPAHGDFLSKERIHLLTAYVMSLSHIPE